MRAALLIVSLLFALAGCKSKESQLVGTWKAEPIKPISSPNLADVQRSSMMSLATQNLEIEFNKEGAFKFGAGMGWGGGNYKWDGDNVILTFNTMAPQTPLKLHFEGNDLVEVTEFQTDVKLKFKKKS